MKENITIVEDDITTLATDAICCQANTDLEMDDNITASLLRKGGDEILNNCNEYENLQRGQAVITKAGALSCKYIIHVILYTIGEENEDDGDKNLMDGVRQALHLAKEKELKSLAFPLLGSYNTGIPIRRAAELIMAEIKKHMESDTSLETVICVGHNHATYNALEEAYKQIVH